MHVRGYTGSEPNGFTERTAVSFNFSVFPPGGARAPRDPDSPPVELKMHKPGPGVITLGVLIAIGAIIYGASIVWTEILWFRQMSATRVILTQWGAHIGLFAVGMVVATGLLYFSMAYASRHRASSTRGQASASLRAYQEFPLAARLVESGRLDLSPLITASYPLEKAEEAILAASDKTRSMKVVLTGPAL